MPERDTDLFQISIRQVGKHREINVVLGKALNVLPDTELLEPVRNLLHRGRTRRVSATWYALETARPSSRRLTNLKCYSLPEGLFGATAMRRLRKYQEFAARCLQEARSTTDPRLKGFWAEMAQEWRRLVE